MVNKRRLSSSIELLEDCDYPHQTTDARKEVQMDVPVRLQGSNPIVFSVDDDKTGDAYFVLGIRKCGSTLLNQICRSLAKVNSVLFVDVAGTFFRNDIKAGRWLTDPAVVAVLRPGNAYGGFRDMPVCFGREALFVSSPKVLLFRDPRDALVSEYFSNAYSHMLPQGGEAQASARDHLLAERQKALESTTDDYVIARVDQMRRTFLEYRFILSDSRLLTLKYEDVVFDKPKMVRAIVEHFGWRCSDFAMGKIVERVDVRPTSENPKAFVRKVTPGDHQEKLKPATIRFLNDKLRDVLDLYGYQT